MSLNLTPGVLLDGAELVLDMYSLTETEALAEGVDVRGNLGLFLWLNRGTDRHPRDKILETRGNPFDMHVISYIVSVCQKM